jgi:hypothetical protein
MDIGDSFRDMLDNVIQTIPKMLVFGVIVVVGWFIARMARKAVLVLLERLGFDRMVERGMIGDVLRRSDYDASGLLAAIVYYGILLITLQLAFGAFGANPVSALLTSIVSWLPKAVVAIVLVVVAAAIAKVVRDLVGTALGGMSYGPLVATAASIFILALGVIAALNQIGVATAITQPVLITVLATVGACVAIGVGGGLVRPMQERWERLLSAAERETGKTRGDRNPPPV